MARLRPPAVVAACALAVALASCIPIPLSTYRSPTVVGVVRRTDGTPVSGARVAVSASRDDRTCQRALVIATTDSAGAFRLPGAKRRQYVSLMERVYWYQVCVGDPDNLHLAFQWGGLGEQPPARDSLACVESQWAWGNRVDCSSVRRR